MTGEEVFKAAINTGGGCPQIGMCKKCPVSTVVEGRTKCSICCECPLDEECLETGILLRRQQCYVTTLITAIRYGYLDEGEIVEHIL